MKYPNDSFQPLFNKISPIIKHEKIYKAIHRQLMTKWFQTSVLLCMVYYCHNIQFIRRVGPLSKLPLFIQLLCIPCLYY